jgi:hypothetical protein
MKRVRIAGVLLLVGASVGAYFALRPRPMPDYENDPLDEIFDYTLLSDEFNRLPVEKRIELVSSIIGRLKNMGSGDSAMLAAFAAGIMGSAREQLEQNASKLAIDLWDKYADDYAKMKGEDRGAYLDKTFVEFQKTMELMGGQPPRHLRRGASQGGSAPGQARPGAHERSQARAQRQADGPDVRLHGSSGGRPRRWERACPRRPAHARHDPQAPRPGPRDGQAHQRRRMIRRFRGRTPATWPVSGPRCRAWPAC